jgi:hypothetical protein
MKIYQAEEAAHLERDLHSLIAAAELGDRIERHLLDAKDPFSLFLAKARNEFMAAVQHLLDVDLHTDDGVAEARRQQAIATRYRDMCIWITDALEARAAAVEALEADGEDEAVEQLKDQMNVNRAKPAPDA